MIKMFSSKFISNLPQPHGNNPWIEVPKNKNFKTRFHRQCDYLLGSQASRKRNNLVLRRRWPRNNNGEKDDPYKTPTLAHNREMDQLVVANTFNNEMKWENILRPNDEKENEGPETTHLRDKTLYSNEEDEEPTTPKSIMDEEVKEPVMPRPEMGSNVVNITL